MKALTFLTIGLLVISPLQGSEHAKSAYLEIPLNATKRADQFLNGQALIVKSERVLERCVRALELTKTWQIPEQEAVKKLATLISSKRQEGTDLILITVTGKDTEESKNLLDRLLEAVISNHTKSRLELEQERLETLDDELQKQGDVVQDKRKALTVLMQQYGIPYFEGREVGPVGVTEEKLYANAREKLDALEKDSAMIKVKIDKVLSTSPKDLIRIAAGLELPDNQVAHFYHQHRDHVSQMAALQVQDLAKDDPEIKLLASKAESALSQAEKEVVSLKEVLKFRLTLVNRQIERMREMVSEQKSDVIDLSMQQHNYNQAMKEYEMSLDLLHEMKANQQRARIELNMPISYGVYQIP